MATLTAKLTLSSTDLLTDSLNLSTTTTFTAAHTTGINRKKITSTAKGTALGQVIIDTADQFGSPNIIYIKNTANYHASTGVVYVYIDTAADDPMFFQIHGQQFVYMPTTGDFTIKAYTSTSGTVVEFGVFGTE